MKRFALHRHILRSLSIYCFCFTVHVTRSKTYATQRQKCVVLPFTMHHSNYLEYKLLIVSSNWHTRSWRSVTSRSVFVRVCHITSDWTLQKTADPSLSRCRLRCQLKWAEGTGRHLANTIERLVFGCDSSYRYYFQCLLPVARSSIGAALL